MNTILFDTRWEDFLPLTYTRPVSDLRIGIWTIAEKWEKHLNQSVSCQTEDYLQEKYPLVKEGQNRWINSSVLPDQELVAAIQNMTPGSTLKRGDVEIARVEDEAGISEGATVEYESDVIVINYPWDLFLNNGAAVKEDFKLLGTPTGADSLRARNQVFGDQIYVEEGAKVQGAILNCETGPIYIGKDAEIMEGSVIRGPFALCEHATVKLNAKIYGPTTIGPHSKVGGEISNSIIWGYSNKGHDGFIGNSVLGQWCNLGADTNSSNLKNNYGLVQVWNYPKKGYLNSGQQFCGLIMGDHSKTGINTMLNTATVVGVSCNLYGAGFPKKFIPSFTWGGEGKYFEYRVEKAYQTAELVMERRSTELSEEDRRIMKEAYERDQDFRKNFS
ncbi:GlmU family protein [bacterium SCSIO 12741]|nr:GlmU family protein [bacterium SCSIO 12741]